MTIRETPQIKKMVNIMIDLETVSNTPDAAILSLGAVMFDLDTRTLGDTFYTVIDLDSAVNQGGSMNPSTVMWWMRQSDAARGAFVAKGKPIEVALNDFTKWLDLFSQYEDRAIWGNGAAFDNVILASAYRNAGLRTPWKFTNDRCYRTLKALHPEVEFNRIGELHNALDDAKSQATHAVAMLG